MERATLLFVVRNGEVLLIHKKRGLGAGKINGPGGRIDDGESPLEAAVREVEEELCVTPCDVTEMGVLRFQFVDGFSILVHVFKASDCEGVPQTTDEAEPLWMSMDCIPYDSMWADDRYWLPLLLQGRRFDGRFIFDGDALVDFDVMGLDNELSEIPDDRDAP
jgi:8-oxo-dGTP diphosphatase